MYKNLSDNTQEPDYSNMSLREELEERIKRANELNNHTEFRPKQETDYSNMTLREELEARVTSAEQQKQQTTINPEQTSSNCYAKFNGETFDLYNNNKRQYSLEAMSGKPEYQCKKYQNRQNEGPIPEGTYHMYQDQRQTIDPLRAVLGLSYQWGWKGSVPAWGLRRVPLVPDKRTNTYGRSGFFSHGGMRKGSAGCIDTPYQTKKISNFLDNCQYDVPVYVKYPKECW